jgi:hypothetical protein
MFVHPRMRSTNGEMTLRAKSNFGLSCKLNREIKMFSTAKVALSAAIALSTVFPASAATRHSMPYRVTRVDPQIYNVAGNTAGGGCSPVHPPLCSNICTGSGPCAPPDSW